MKNLPLLLGTIIGTLALIVVIAVTSSDGSATSGQNQQITDTTLLMGDARNLDTPIVETTQTNQINQEDNQENPPIAQEDTINSTNALDSTTSAEPKQELITIVEFSDFQCPACKSALPVLERVKSIYSDKVQIVFRHFPLDSIHPNARLAATASEAAASLDQTKFWAFHDRLFAEQEAWSGISSRIELKNTFATYATDLGLDTVQFLEKMEDTAVIDLVNADVAAATQLGVNSTPTFYVNGIKTSTSGLLSTVESLME